MILPGPELSSSQNSALLSTVSSSENPKKTKAGALENGISDKIFRRNQKNFLSKLV